MLRKLVLAVAAVAAIGGATAVSTTPAAAWHGGHGWHGGGHGWHGGFRGYGGPRFYYGGGPYAYSGGGCYVRRLVPTPWGPRWRVVNRCY